MGLLHSAYQALKCFDPARYERHLRSLPLLFATPAIALYATDLRSYEINSNIHHRKNTAQAIIDAVALTFLSLSIIWSLVWSWTSPQGLIGLCFVVIVDILCTAALEGVADTTFSQRTSANACLKFVDSCDGTSTNIMRAAGGLALVTGIMQQFSGYPTFSRTRALWRQRRRERKRNTGVMPETTSPFEFHNSIP